MLAKLNSIVTDYSKATVLSFDRGKGIGFNSLFQRMTELSDFDAAVGGGNNRSSATVESLNGTYTLDQYKIKKSSSVQNDTGISWLFVICCDSSCL